MQLARRLSPALMAAFRFPIPVRLVSASRSVRPASRAPPKIRRRPSWFQAHRLVRRAPLKRAIFDPLRESSCSAYILTSLLFINYGSDRISYFARLKSSLPADLFLGMSVLRDLCQPNGGGRVRPDQAGAVYGLTFLFINFLDVSAARCGSMSARIWLTTFCFMRESSCRRSGSSRSLSNLTRSAGRMAS